MIIFMNRLIASTLALLLIVPALGARAELVVVDFEDLSLPPNSFFNGNPGGLNPGDSAIGTFTSRGAEFNNRFQVFPGGFESWNGWSYSNMGDTTTAGFTNQYSSFTGGAFSGDIFGVAFGSSAYINLPDLSFEPIEMTTRITNTTYAALSMRDGDTFSPAFEPGDFFRLTITGFEELAKGGSEIGSVDFYLADYRAGAESIVDTWELVDLTSLIGAQSLGFSFSAGPNHISPFGLTIPAYFALDDLTIVPVPEPAALILLAIGGLGFAVMLQRSGRLGVSRGSLF